MKVDFGHKPIPSRIYSGGNSERKSSQDLLMGRVVDIVLDSSHPLYAQFGESQSLYGIQYALVGKSKDEGRLFFAYCNPNGFRKLPIRQEIVRLEFLHSAETQDLNPEDVKLYWTEIVSTWNHPHYNVSPDILRADKRGINLGKFVEREDINPIQLYEGDLIVEGRYGQSFRMGGWKVDDSNIKFSESQFKGYTLLRNGQKKVDLAPFETVGEDINLDDSSIYLTSGYQVNIKDVQTKTTSWLERYTSLSKSSIPQIILVGDRLVLQGKKEHVLISAKRDIGLVGQNLHFDATSGIYFDATKIYLGQDSYSEVEPLLKGDTTVTWMSDLLEALDMIIGIMSSAPSSPDVWVPTVSATAVATQTYIKTLKNRLVELKSQKIFVE